MIYPKYFWLLLDYCKSDTITFPEIFLGRRERVKLLPFRSRKCRENVRIGSSWSPRPEVVQGRVVQVVYDNRVTAGQSPSGR